MVPLLVISAGCALYYWVERPLLEAGRASAERWFPKIMARRVAREPVLVS